MENLSSAAPGEYKIYAKFADEHIEGSPFTCKVTGEGTKRKTISVGATSDLSLPENLSEYDLRSLNAYIVSPSGTSALSQSGGPLTKVRVVLFSLPFLITTLLL